MADLTLIVTALVMFMAGACAGAGNGSKSTLPTLAAVLGLLNAALWAYQNMAGTGASWFRPDYSLFGTETDGTGLFGYKNFSAHFLSITGFFLCAWSMASLKKWGVHLFAGLLLVAASFTCDSRAAFPNALIGVTLCFFIYTSSVFRNNRKFYTAAILFFLLLFFSTAYVVLDLTSGAGSPDVHSGCFHFRQPDYPFQTGVVPDGAGPAFRPRQPDVHQSGRGVFPVSQCSQFHPS